MNTSFIGTWRPIIMFSHKKESKFCRSLKKCRLNMYTQTIQLYDGASYYEIRQTPSSSILMLHDKSE